MNIRHLTDKSFEKLTYATQAIVDGRPFMISQIISTTSEINTARQSSTQDMVGGVRERAVEDIKSVVPSFEKGMTLKDTMATGVEKTAELTKLAETLFPFEDYTRLDPKGVYTPYIPLVVATGAIPAQVSAKDELVFNPDGCVTVAEFLDGLSVLAHGKTNPADRKKSLDNVSNVQDYFNVGYNDCLDKYSNPFFNLYTRDELLKPITRIEAAYILVLCWTGFREYFDSPVRSKHYDLGISFNWKKPGSVLKKYGDGFANKFRTIVNDSEGEVISLDIKDYLGGATVGEYLKQLQNGEQVMALPYIMSLVELGEVGLFDFSDGNLHPIYELSRGEWCYLITSIASLKEVK